tara:strand:- start:306 stop:632 length:327 start_codon:yes stop_codon:yes gene_type:complete
MSRYSKIPIIFGSNPVTNPKDRKPRLANIKYPFIPISGNDIYIFVTEGDRYDILAQQYYKDSSLWWIISTSNYSVRRDSLLPTVGTQIRIPSPSRLSQILSNYDSINS